MKELSWCEKIVYHSKMYKIWIFFRFSTTTGFDVLQVERLKLFDAMFNLSAYRHPENIALPKG